MKNQIILLLSSLVIIFLAGYIESVTDPNFPVTGTFGIEGKSKGSFGKVSYKLNKTHFGDSTFKVVIISDVQNLEGEIEWKQDEDWQSSKMKNENNNLIGTIDSQKPNTEIEYRVILSKNDREYIIPEKKTIHLTFFGEIPSFISLLYSILLYGGLFLSIRSGLEVFNESKMLKKFLFIQAAVFLLLAILISPLYVSYKLAAVNHTILPITTLLDFRITMIALISILSGIIVFNVKKNFVIPLISSSLVIVIFIFIN